MSRSSCNARMEYIRKRVMHLTLVSCWRELSHKNCISNTNTFRQQQSPLKQAQAKWASSPTSHPYPSSSTKQQPQAHQPLKPSTEPTAASTPHHPTKTSSWEPHTSKPPSATDASTQQTASPIPGMGPSRQPHTHRHASVMISPSMRVMRWLKTVFISM